MMTGLRRFARAVLLLAGTTGIADAAPGEAALSSDPCGSQAARYESGKGFTLLVLRAGAVRIDNPLRPLTPDITHVLEVAVNGKRASVYGPDFTSLRRGGPPGAMQGALGAPIRWDAGLKALPDPLGIVTEDGKPLAELSFRACEPPPALAPDKVPQAMKKDAPKKDASKTRSADAKGTGAAKGGTKAGAKGDPKGAPKPAPKETAKTPSGFSLPQGAIAE